MLTYALIDLCILFWKSRVPGFLAEILSGGTWGCQKIKRGGVPYFRDLLHFYVTIFRTSPLPTVCIYLCASLLFQRYLLCWALPNHLT